MKQLFLSFIFILTSFVSFTQDFEFHRPTPQLRGVTHSLRSDTMDVLNYGIHLYVPTSSGNIYGWTDIDFTLKMNNISSISFDLLKMNIDSVKIGATNLAYTYDDTLLIAFFPSPLNITDTQTISIFYRGIPQMDPSSWGGWYFSSGYAFNLGVGFESLPHNFGRVWHPCFDNFMEHATYDFYITTSINNKAYCNGYLVSDTIDLNGDRVRYWRMEDEITSYLASVAVADYTQVNQEYISTITGDTIPIQLTSLAADTAAFITAFVNLPYAIEAFEESYGAHFFNKIGYVAVPFSSGAMEHATNIAYPKSFLGGTFFESVMAHELSHHWWGDLVTCKSAEDMWINEGMATYSEKLFFENRYGTSRYKSEVRSNHKNTVWKHHIDDGGYWALSAVPQVVTYGSTSYNKGSDVAHTMRGYLGDSLFFLGLKTIITNNQLQNINSNDFMNQLNLVNGINVTDFFNDWVNTPGYPHFSVDSFTVAPNGGNFDVTIYAAQKLRGRTTFSNNVPITVTCRDENWNYYTEKIMVSGQNSNATITVPFTPSYVSLNEDEWLSDATTADQFVISSTGSKNYVYANLILQVQSVTDSLLVRVEHNWVPPQQDVTDPTTIISPDRYWKIYGTNWNNFTTNAAFTYNGTTSGSGYLDDGLMVNHGAVVFHEDSIILMYRPHSGVYWSEHPDYTLNIQSNPTNKTGVIIANNIQPGEYAFGMRVYGLGIDEKNKTDIKLFPNPNDGNFSLDMGTTRAGNYQFQIIDLNGKIVEEKKSSDRIIQFNTKNLSNGMYYLSIKTGKKIIANVPLTIQR